MALRLLELVVPDEAWEAADLDVAAEHPIRDSWSEELDGGLRRIRFLLEAESAEPLLDLLERRFSGQESYSVMLLPVEASLPRPEEEPEEEGEAEAEAAPPGTETDEAEEDEKDRLPDRISREELRTQLADGSETTPVYLAMVALSALVCAFGLLTDDVAVVIGAMVIAPLLAPLVALSLATTLADHTLARQGLTSGVAGIVTALAISVLLGVLLPVDPGIPQIGTRTTAGLEDVAVALAAGSAGTVAFTSGLPAAVIGVMVAVALVPPLVAAGLLAGAGFPAEAAGAGLLTLINLICINLAGVVTFLVQGVLPHRWWEAEQAKRATRLAVGVWTALLLILVAVILFTPAGQGVRVFVGPGG